jgi:hypothetical protein
VYHSAPNGRTSEIRSTQLLSSRGRTFVSQHLVSVLLCYGRGGGVGRGLGVGANLGVGDGLAVAVGVGETVPVAVGVDVGVVVAVGVAVTVGVGVTVKVGVGVGVGAPNCAQYLPPVFRGACVFSPPQASISLPVHTAVCSLRASGALAVLVAVQVSVLGLYLPPVFKPFELSGVPPQTIISLLVHTAV